MTDTMVAGAGGAGVANATPVPGGVATATPVQAPTDAEWQRKLDEARAQAVAEAKRENEIHIGRAKSALQSKIDQIERDREAEREAFRARMFELETKGLDEAERVKFENRYYQDTLTERENQLQETQRQLQEMTAAQSYYDYFAGLGVPSTKLVRDQGLQVLLQSGWAAVQERVQDLEAKASAAVATPAPAPAPTPAPATPAGAVTPPPVVVENAAAPGVKVSWPELRQRYGFKPDDWTADDELYRKMERGEIKPEAMPQ